MHFTQFEFKKIFNFNSIKLHTPILLLVTSIESSHVCALDDGAFYAMHHLFSYLHTNLSCQHVMSTGKLNLLFAIPYPLLVGGKFYDVRLLLVTHVADVN